ncbi:lipopolysaccharide-induced tumor necrosis factor-alpha factor homolog isoform X2 [Mizuhopecten yessoensis]|uniref:lipopolysaccharide-induced tumor necrosis factor-alpha factor homolog isoform X2 n=1 Tax=Mizuhopecten yessoensis TaxID=6573 RepID=UPI000B45A649|nr:lipopolysaccharide-induced tumor necrosis factor-alpha factor homolog isoform X2 [Mizuhopecten yessoensis]
MQQQQPPPPPGYSVQQGQQTVIVTTPGFAANTQNRGVYRENPVSMICPFCQAQIVTSTTYVTGTLAWLICGILLLLGFWLGCCLIPFCIDGCKDVVHNCPNCRQQVGKFNRM